jgi:hypothetical protein
MKLLELNVDVLETIFDVDENYNTEDTEFSTFIKKPNTYMILKVLSLTCKKLKNIIFQYVKRFRFIPPRKFGAEELKYAIKEGSLDFLKLVITENSNTLGDCDIVPAAYDSKDPEKFKIIINAGYFVSSLTEVYLGMHYNEKPYHEMATHVMQHYQGLYDTSDFLCTNMLTGANMLTDANMLTENMLTDANSATNPIDIRNMIRNDFRIMNIKNGRTILQLPDKKMILMTLMLIILYLIILPNYHKFRVLL